MIEEIIDILKRQSVKTDADLNVVSEDNFDNVAMIINESIINRLDKVFVLDFSSRQQMESYIYRAFH